jgi:hypothetical protein
VVVFSAGVRDLTFIENVQTGSGAHLAFYLMDIGGFFLRIKRPECKVKQLPTYSAEVKNVRS